MEKFKGTPGPWDIASQTKRGQKAFISGKTWSRHTRIYLYTTNLGSGEITEGSMELGRANAQLIASAPELLEALQGIIYDCGEGFLQTPTIHSLERAVGAINKALDIKEPTL